MVYMDSTRRTFILAHNVCGTQTQTRKYVKIRENGQKEPNKDQKYSAGQSWNTKNSINIQSLEFYEYPNASAIEFWV